MKATVLGPLLALIIGGAAGFFAGKNTSPVTSDDSKDATESRSARRGGGSSSSSGSSSSRSARVKSAKEALSLPGQNNRLESLMDYYARLDPAEFEAEAKKLEDLPWGERFMVGYLLFARWGEEDPTSAMAYSKEMGFAGMFVRGTVMQSWASKSPEEAAKYYSDNPNEFRMGGMMGGRGRGGRGGGSTASIIATEWARQDSAGAMSWAQSLEGRDQRDAVRSIVSQAAKDDPAKAAEMLTTITDEDAKRDAQNSIAREWGKQSWDDAKAWVATLPADQQASAMSRALRGLADEDPQAAAANITSIPEGEGRDDVTASIAREWGNDDAPAAAKWLMETGSAEAQQEGIGRVVSSWVGQDVAAAYEFVNSQPEGEVRDSAASSYVMSNQAGDVQQNLKLAESIGNERSRSWAIGMTAASWARTDKEAATNYIENTDAIGDQAKSMIKRFSEGGGRGFGRGRGGR
ncbi:MAG: hypothetical protein ACPGUY_03835 [Akkermansiaceae bacterium]